MIVSTPVRNVRLYGVLGSKFGRHHRLAVTSPAEAIRALCLMIPGFEAFLMNAKDRGLTFSVFVGKANIGKDELPLPSGSEDIRIAPVLIGSKKNGVLQTILGVILVVVGYVLTAFGYGAIGQPMAKLGFAMIMGGVAQMLAPTPKGLGAKDSPQNESSYSFNGPVNTQAQGNPVPVLYGRLKVGSAVISAGILSEDAIVPYSPCSGFGNSQSGPTSPTLSGMVRYIQDQEGAVQCDPGPGEGGSGEGGSSGGSGGGGSPPYYDENLPEYPELPLPGEDTF